MPEPNEIRKIAARVTAHYEILSAGLSMVRKEMAAGFADTREALVGLRREVGSVQGDVESMQGSLGSMQGSLGSMQGSLGSMQGSLESMQGSIARLAHQQDERAARIDHVLDETLEKSRWSMADLSAAFEVVARQYDVLSVGLNELDGLKARLAAVEEVLAKLLQKADDAA